MVALPEIYLNTLSYGLEISEEHRVKRIKYGDGYSSRVANGINNLEQELTLQWDVLTVAEALTLRDFWRERKGTESVQFTPPDYTSDISVVAVGKLSIKYVSYNTRSCSISVERVYDNV